MSAAEGSSGLLGSKKFQEGYDLDFVRKGEKVVDELHNCSKQIDDYFIQGLAIQSWSYETIPDSAGKAPDQFLSAHGVPLEAERVSLKPPADLSSKVSAVSTGVSPAYLVSSQVLPYAQELIFQSIDAIEEACNEFEAAVDIDLDRFVQLSQESAEIDDYLDAYQIWSDLLFRYCSLNSELGRTNTLSQSKEFKSTVLLKKRCLKQVFQQKLSAHPELLSAFLKNAHAASKLTPQQRFITENILKECQKIDLKEQINNALQKLSFFSKEAFTRSWGLAPPLMPETLSELKVLTANIICFRKNLTYLYGGIPPWEERIDRLVERICNTGAHIVCLQEVWDPQAMRALVERLKDHYACFVYNAGDSAGTLQVSKINYNSGLFIASKLSLDEVVFNQFPRKIPEEANRGALLATCRIAQDRIALITTHLQHGATPQMCQISKEQLSLCSDYLQELVSRTLPDRSWGFLAGDLNIDAFKSDYDECGLSQLFSTPYTTHSSDPMADKIKKATYTNYFSNLVAKPRDQRKGVTASYHLLDYCVTPTFSRVTRESSQTLVPLFSVDLPIKTLSDHQGLLTAWNISPVAAKANSLEESASFEIEASSNSSSSAQKSGSDFQSLHWRLIRIGQYENETPITSFNIEKVQQELKALTLDLEAAQLGSEERSMLEKIITNIRKQADTKLISFSQVLEEIDFL